MFLEGSSQGSSRMQSLNRNFQFRKNIRKEELQTYFQQRRKQLLQIGSHNEKEDILQELKTAAAQQQFLKNIGCQLTGEPNYSWMKIIEKLSSSIFAFVGEFDAWISQSIIKCLCYALKQQYKHLKLAPKICVLLHDMVYLSWEKATDFGSRLMQYQPVIDVINLAHDKALFSISERLDFLMLLGNICHFSALYRQSVVRDGGGSLIVDYGRQIIASGAQISEKMVIHFITAARRFIRIFRKASHQTSPPLSLVYTLIPIVVNFYMIDKISNRILNSSLDFLVETACCQKAAVYKNLANYQGLLQRTIHLIMSEDPIVRSRSVHLMSYFTYSDVANIHTDIIALKMFDFMQNSIQTWQSGRNKTFAQVALLSLSNLAAVSQKIATQILDHPVFMFVLQNASSPITDLQKEALCCLSNMLQNLKLNTLRQVLQKYEIIRLLVKGLYEMKTLDAKITAQIIGILHRLIENTQNHFYVDSFNPLLDELERVYNFSVQLQNMVNTSHNKIISHAANKLLLYLSEIQCQDVSII